MIAAGFFAPELRDREFIKLRDYVYAEAGIHLSEAKKALVSGRLQRRLRELRVTNFADYVARVQADTDERRILLEAICTHETSFFREPHHFEFLEKRLCPQWSAARAVKRVRAWSAGCASGEEPFTLAMTLLRALPGWDIEVLATDISTRVLSIAQKGEWSFERAAQIPQALQRQFFQRTDTGLRAGIVLQKAVRFARVNLNHPPPAALGTFDVVFCRNVLIYFDNASKTRALQGLFSRLAPGGHLFVGHAETLHGLAGGARLVAPTIYAGPR